MTAIPFYPESPSHTKIRLEAGVIARQCYDHLTAIGMLAGVSDQQPPMTCTDIAMLLYPVTEQMQVLTKMLERERLTAELHLVFTD